MVRKNAAMCVREVAKHTPELAKLIVNSGGAAALVDYVSESQGKNKLPGIMALGYVYVHVCICTCVYMCVYVHVYICNVCICTCTCVYMCVYVHICICTHIHTRT
jgi:hypothetical protein